jgi:hypothetical protein
LEKKAGIEQFGKFEKINQVNALAGGDVTKWAEVMALPYNVWLTKLLLNKTEAEYQKKYYELITKK